MTHQHDSTIQAATPETTDGRRRPYLKPAFTSVGDAGFDAIVLRRYPQIEAVQHLHTGGTSSGIVDGACAVLLGSQGYGARRGLRARARIVAAATCGASCPSTGPTTFQPQAAKRCAVSSMNQGVTSPSMLMPLSS